MTRTSPPWPSVIEAQGEVRDDRRYPGAMKKRALWAALVIGTMVSGCGLKEEMAAVKKLNDALEQQVGGDPHVNYSVGSEGKVVKIKFFGELKDPAAAATTSRKLVDAHLQKVDQLELWKCSKDAAGIETCVGL